MNIKFITLFSFLIIIGQFFSTCTKLVYKLTPIIIINSIKIEEKKTKKPNQIDFFRKINIYIGINEFF